MRRDDGAACKQLSGGACTLSRVPLFGRPDRSVSLPPWWVAAVCDAAHCWPTRWLPSFEHRGDLLGALLKKNTMSAPFEGTMGGAETNRTRKHIFSVQKTRDASYKVGRAPGQYIDTSFLGKVPHGGSLARPHCLPSDSVASRDAQKLWPSPPGPP